MFTSIHLVSKHLESLWKRMYILNKTVMFSFELISAWCIFGRIQSFVGERPVLN